MQLYCLPQSLFEVLLKSFWGLIKVSLNAAPLRWWDQSLFGVFLRSVWTLQSCTVKGQNRVFPVKFSTQGTTCFHYREPLFSLQGPLFSLKGFPCEKTSQGKPCFHYRELVCSVHKTNPGLSYFKLSYVFWEHNDSIGRWTTVYFWHRLETL